MKVLIPMGGRGQRFLDAGITTPKPLIEVHGMPVIEHIVRNFSSDHEFVFGVNEEHLGFPGMRETLERIAPGSRIISVPYQKEGPIGVLGLLFDRLEGDDPVIVNYCDFSWAWNEEDFRMRAAETECDGAVLCYRGFHPHLLGSNLYATLDADGLWMKEIREKYSWHENKFDDWTSSGTYYFKSLSLLRKCCEEISRFPEWKINDEFYVSQLFQVLHQQGGRVLIYEIDTMLQWGTPEDLSEYRYRSVCFEKLAARRPGTPVKGMTGLVLMAGAGRRFADQGFRDAKPLLPVEGEPMAAASVRGLPQAEKYILVTRPEVLRPGSPEQKRLESRLPGAQIMRIEHLTEGQASTALLARDRVDADQPLLICACDHGVVLDQVRFGELVRDRKNGPESIIFTFRNDPAAARSPAAYGWVRTGETGEALEVSCKVPLAGDPLSHHAIMGAFWFRRAGLFFEAAEKMIAAQDRVNHEYYIDQAMNYVIRRPACVRVFEVDAFFSWGTPDDYMTHTYWQNFFKQAPFHPYGEPGSTAPPDLQKDECPS